MNEREGLISVSDKDQRTRLRYVGRAERRAKHLLGDQADVTRSLPNNGSIRIRQEENGLQINVSHNSYCVVKGRRVYTETNSAYSFKEGGVICHVDESVYIGSLYATDFYLPGIAIVPSLRALSDLNQTLRQSVARPQSNR